MDLVLIANHDRSSEFVLSFASTESASFFVSTESASSFASHVHESHEEISDKI